MNLATALGISLAALTVAASASPQTHVFVRHGGPEATIDANEDGWITRAEAAAAFERIFDHMDSNDDGRLTSEDSPAALDVRIRRGEGSLELEGENCTQTVEPRAGAAPTTAGRTVERRITVICRNGDGETERSERRLTILRGGDALSPEEHARIQREIDEAMRDADRASREAERAERQAERLEEQAERLAERAERQVRREVIVINGEGNMVMGTAPPVPGVGPMRPPMFMMLFASSNEADSNGDGALSREEFRTQHLRFFDASDVNGDGRVQFEPPPSAPDAPEPPTPPR